MREGSIYIYIYIYIYINYYYTTGQVEGAEVG